MGFDWVKFVGRVIGHAASSCIIAAAVWYIGHRAGVAVDFVSVAIAAWALDYTACGLATAVHLGWHLHDGE